MGKLRELIGIVKSSRRVFIQMHNSPDPDAIASAFGLQYLLSLENIPTVICYKGEIDKYNTQRMIELLNIEVRNIRNIADMREDDHIILVDSQAGNSNVSDFIGCEVAAIDHHPSFQEVEYDFVDIRPEIGACSTIIAQYFMEDNIPIPEAVATALLYGIKMDTLELLRGASELDLDMFYALHKLSEIDIINKIQMNTLQFEELIAYGNAIKNIRIYGNVGFANVGINCPDSLLGTISDFIISIKEVEFSIVYSPRENGIKFSLRNEIDGLDAGRVINTALEGIGNGGGHKAMAGGFLPTGKLVKTYGELEPFLEDRFLEIIETEGLNKKGV
ncbi:MAG: DHH family phosphoesterase [Bacillota bacterium]|nr:DHH family phosphoesterase [Bacillota bacterium]